MSSGMDSSILDTYLYEENNLLDQLDEMLVADEKNGDFSTDDVNEIFRIMHTIKGSSAMMEFNSISTIAHHIEDVFFYIRDKGIETLDPEHKKELFNLMFRSEDYLRSEIEKVEQGVPLSTDIDAFSNEINSFLKKISGAAPAQPEASQAAPAASGASALPRTRPAQRSTGAQDNAAHAPTLRQRRGQPSARCCRSGRWQTPYSGTDRCIRPAGRRTVKGTLPCRRLPTSGRGAFSWNSCKFPL